jgi:heterodisulfide reductase subunit C
MYSVMGKTFNTFEEVIKFAEELGLVYEAGKISEEEKQEACIMLEHLISSSMESQDKGGCSDCGGCDGGCH